MTSNNIWYQDKYIFYSILDRRVDNCDPAGESGTFQNIDGKGWDLFPEPEPDQPDLSLYNDMQ